MLHYRFFSGKCQGTSVDQSRFSGSKVRQRISDPQLRSCCIGYCQQSWQVQWSYLLGIFLQVSLQGLRPCKCRCTANQRPLSRSALPASWLQSLIVHIQDLHHEGLEVEDECRYPKTGPNMDAPGRDPHLGLTLPEAQVIWTSARCKEDKRKQQRCWTDLVGLGLQRGLSKTYFCNMYICIYIYTYNLSTFSNARPRQAIPMQTLHIIFSAHLSSVFQSSLYLSQLKRPWLRVAAFTGSEFTLSISTLHSTHTTSLGVDDANDVDHSGYETSKPENKILSILFFYIFLC